VTQVRGAGVLVPGVPTHAERPTVDRATWAPDPASTVTTGSAHSAPTTLPMARVPPVLGCGSHRKRLPFGVLLHESIIDQILYITDFVADPPVPPWEHYDIVSENFYDYEIDNFCFDNHDNGSDNVSNDIYTVCDDTFIDDISSDTISRIVHTNTTHDNVDNATMPSELVNLCFGNHDNGSDNMFLIIFTLYVMLFLFYSILITFIALIFQIMKF
jgi:hypothetical protein